MSNVLQSSCQDFLPLNPKRIINLWDMVQVSVKEIIRVLDLISDRQETIQNRWPREKEEQKVVVWALIRVIEQMMECAQKLELKETRGRCEQFKDSLETSISPLKLGEMEITLNSFTPPEFARELKGISEAAENEIRQKQFAFIPTDKGKFFEQEKLFGEKVYDSFPSARQEIKDAGNCLAADLNTAAVFHLMRVAELGMRALARYLKIKLIRNTIDSANWTEIINKIEDATAARWNKRPKTKSARRKATDFLKFCEVATDELNVFKEIWRNNVMHAGSPYNEHEAHGVFIRVRDFMQRLAAKISETNN